MPGYFISDPGDLIRSMACSADENCIDFENLHIRKDYYQAITEGYFSVMEKSFTTTAEKKYFSLFWIAHHLYAGSAFYY